MQRDRSRSRERRSPPSNRRDGSPPSGSRGISPGRRPPVQRDQEAPGWRGRDAGGRTPQRGGRGSIIGRGRGRPAPIGGGVGGGPLVVDRVKACPFLLRVFYKIDGLLSLEDYDEQPQPEELQVYAWRDATLRELVDLIKDVSPETRDRNARLEISMISSNLNGIRVLRHLGNVHSTRIGPTDGKTLASLRFRIGDPILLGIQRGRRPNQIPKKEAPTHSPPKTDPQTA